MDKQKLTNSSNGLAGGVQLVKERNRSSNKVKLCGYLKKKRNKVGGWRKMWFVLQDKLLLSYASKEEYDNKLVSFKDVLNLVPGTMVRPLGGFRFTIETTTHVMYTFHCDDRNAYREWITMLLDSLTATSSAKIISANSSVSAYALLPIQQQRFRNTSVDNIPYALWSTVGQNSQRQRELSSSCDSMRQRVELVDANGEYAYSERMANVKTRNGLKPATRSPLAPALSLPNHSSGAGGGGGGFGAAVRLPIARSTAKLLERNGVNSSDPLKKYQQQQQQQPHYQKRQQQQQVSCCSRSSGTTAGATSSKSHNHNSNNNNANENVTDARLTTEACATHFRLHGESNCGDFTTLDNGRNSSSTASTSSSASASACHGPVNQTVLQINSMFQRQTNTCTAPESASSASRQRVVNNEFPIYPKSTLTNCDQNKSIPKYKRDNKANQKKRECNNNLALLADSCSMSDDAEAVVDNIAAAYCSNSQDSPAMVLVKDQIQRMNIKGRKETLSYANAEAAVERHEQRRVVLTKKLEAETFIETKPSMNKTVAADEANGGSVDSDVESVGDGEQQQLVVESAASATGNRSSEPIYAVVDLAHKYAQRQQRNVRNNLKSLETNRCRSYESIIQGVESSVVLTNGSGALGKSNSNLHEDDIDGIYEDGDNFAPNCEIAGLTKCDEDENIYEPVGFDNFGSQKIPASAAQPNAFWRYITRLKVNSLLQFTRMRRHHHTDYDSIDLATPSPSPTPTASKRKTTASLAKKLPAGASAGTTIPTTNTTSSQFASIKRKFGAHRKSMQVRVRKICARNYEPKTATFGSKQATQQQQQKQQNGDGHFAVRADDGAVNGLSIVSGVGGAAKKTKYHWKSVKIRPKHFNGAYNGNNCGTSCTTDDISCKSTRRQSFFGSLPHLRKARVSLFSTPNLHLTAKDQNSNVSNASDGFDKATADKRTAERKREYEELTESS